VKQKKLEKVFNAASKEEGILEEQQPLYIDQDDGKIKCYWCKDSFQGSVQLKHINQHVRKSSTHQKRRKDHLRTGGGQCDLREYMSPDIHFDL